MTDLARAMFKIDGIVQGVGYRYFVLRYANLLGLYGYAKNLWDGSVEAVVEGKSQAIRELHELLKKGPSHSKVISCKVEYSEYKGEFHSFDIY